MSSSEERKGTKFIWKIENFSCLKDMMLPSPTFCSHSGNWEVRIKSTAFEDVKCFEIEVCRFQNAKEIFSCSLAFLDSDGFPLIWEQKINVKCSVPYLGLPKWIDLLKFRIKKNELFGSRRNAILPNNTLTVQCLIWQTLEELVVPLQCFARTRIEPKAEIFQKTFIWNIENAKSFEAPQTRVGAMGRNFDSLTIKLSLNNDDKFHVMFKPSLFGINLKFKISVLDLMGKNNHVIIGKLHFNGKEQQCGIMTNVTKTMLMLYDNLFLPQDTLSLQFVCNLSANITFHRMVNEDEILVNNPSTYFPVVPSSPISKPIERTDQPKNKQPTKSDQADSISQAFQKLYEEGFLSDCILKVGSREFPVHKAVLGVRSEVFKAMFTTDMKEKDGNCVDIQDVDGDTLQRLLMFVYSGSIDRQMGWENAVTLYSGADKYALESLKLTCSEILESELYLSSALQILTLADMHQDQRLKSAALDFISNNDAEIISTDSWLKLEEENAKLAFETLRKLYHQKVIG